MDCDQCRERTYSIYITRDYEKLCYECYIKTEDGKSTHRHSTSCKLNDCGSHCDPNACQNE